jgi:hypothetical protein
MQTEAIACAEKIIDSDLMPTSTARAVIDAYRAAGAQRVTPEHFIPAAKAHRAKVSAVAAACGWGRCWHCKEWRDVGAEPSTDPGTCACVVDFKDTESWAALCVYLLCGGPLLQSFSTPSSVRFGQGSRPVVE